MSFFSIFFIAGLCLAFYTILISYLIWSKTPKENKPVVWGNESTHPLPTYQIHPTESCGFYVKKLESWGGWLIVKDYTMFSTPVRRTFSTQEEAEKWIAGDFLVKEDMIRRENEGKEFIKNNPPYGVPPFKFLKQ